MKIVVFVALLGSLGTLRSHAQTAPVCQGEERWNVKTLADPDAAKVDKTPVEKTVDDMVKLTRPEKVDATLPRMAGTETTTYKLNATLTLYKQEADRDYHLVLEDDHNNTMIARIPDPECVAKDSPVRAQITKARQEFDAAFKVGPDMHAAKIPVTVVGVGFFDIVHGGAGQIGHAENNIELHPVLDIQFNGPRPPEFEPAAITATASTTSGISPQYWIMLLMWAIISIGMTVFYAIAIRETVGTLRRSNDWSLAKALQESDGKPSSSRLIAFLGLLILMVLYMELGYVVIWRLLNNESMPSVQPFLLTGLSLFAPYAFNQIKQFALGIGSGGSNNDSSAAARGVRSAPKVLAVTPNSVSANTSTQITVSGIAFDPKATIWVTASGVPVPITPTLVSATQIQFGVTMPAAAAPYVAVVHILNPDGNQTTGTFQVS